MRQSARVFSFAIAAVSFAAFTYAAFFRTALPPPNAIRPGFFSAGWWLRPIEFNSASRLHHVEPGVDFTCISALVGGGHIWVGGSAGLLIHSADDGQTWEQLPVIAASPAPFPVRAQPKSVPVKLSRAKIPEERSEIIRVGMPEKTPRPDWQNNPANQINRGKGSVEEPTPSPPDFQMEQRPLNQAAPDANPAQTQAPVQKALPPILPPLLQSLSSNTLVDLQFVTTTRGFAVTDSGEVIATNDGGNTWRMLRPAGLGDGPAKRVRFADERRGIVVGEFGGAGTDDGGETWSVQDAALSIVQDLILTSGLNGLAVGSFPEIAEVVDGKGSVSIGQRLGVSGSAPPRFTRIAKGGMQTVFACGTEGAVARSANGGMWQAFATGTQANLSGLFFVSDRVGWVVSEDGRILATQDRGESWTPQTSGTTAALRDIYFASETRGFIAGRNGTLLGTDDGGRTWSPLVTADAVRRGRHAWLPPPWYFATVLLLFGLVRRIPDEAAPPARAGIGQILVSDKPLAPEDRDYLGFREVAWGLSNYLRNKATKAPLTIAITGEWGMGKSSLMNLLHSDLVHYKFRPVWFNAWHHQTEEHLLAALLENIRTQAIPSVITPEGVVFRAKLLWLRARGNLFATLLLIAAIAFVLSYYLNGHYGVVEGLQHLATALKKPFEIPEKLATNSEAATAVVAFLTAVGSLIAFTKSFRAFGVSPASLLASKSNAAKASDLRAQTSFRHKFAAEFREVTESLNPLTMVVFIDDLDRCRPEQVYDMLESINFLISCGDCFIIMGLARRRVERCVGLVFEKIAAEAPDVIDGQTLNDSEKRQRFARQYLEKLINIEVPVPKGEPEQIRTMLINEPAALPSPRKWEVACRKLNDLLPHLVPMVLCLGVAVLAIWCSSFFVQPDKNAAPKTQNVAAANQPSAASAAPLPGFTPPSEALPSAASRLGNAHFIPGRAGSAPFWAILLAGVVLLVPGIIRLSRRSGSVIEDSPAFLKALEEWFPFLTAGAEMTPRSVKRFVNRVRYFAMMEGSFQPALRWWEQLAQFLRRRSAAATPAPAPAVGTGEDLLVALATVHERHPDWFRGDFGSFQTSLRSSGAAQDKALPGDAALLRVEKNMYAHFQKLVAGVEVR